MRRTVRGILLVLAVVVTAGAGLSHGASGGANGALATPALPRTASPIPPFPAETTAPRNPSEF